MVLQVLLYKKFRSFVFVFIFMSSWLMNLPFYMIIYHKEPIAHNILPDETQVGTRQI